MKQYILFISLVISALNSSAQVKNFEGTIKYNVEISGPDAHILEQNKPCTKMDMHFKDNNFIIHTYEGQFPVTRMYIADSSELYIVDALNEVAYRRDKLEDTSKVIKPPKAVFTGDSALVNNLTCAIYRVQKKDEYIFYYVHSDYRIDPALFEGKKDAQVNFLTIGLDGRIPLKTVRKTPNLTVTTTYTAIIPRKFEMGQFRIPKGFPVKPRDNRF